MRTNDVLLEGFDDIRTLLQYLYMFEEHFISVNNGVCELQIRMDEHMRLRQKNMNFPHLPDSVRDICLEELLSMVEQLKKAKPVEHPDAFQNRWEEIQRITDSIIH